MPRWTVALAALLVSACVAAVAASALQPEQSDVASSSASEEAVSTFSRPAPSGDDDNNPVGLGVLAILAGVGLLAIGLRWHRRG